ncbi:MAG: preprotein translocase subunit SecA [Candidatus Magasanikbacteria bacterium]|nr:preprotein translocase subunit SecA [Candidatus Magasanikbacteria bacterium]
MQSMIKKLFGDPNAKEVAKFRKTVDEINALEAEMQALSDDALKAKTAEFKERLAKDEPSEKMIPEVFAVVREVSRRVLKQRQYDVQLIGGLALNKGMIAEMRTGEGKTLTAAAPVYMNALTGKGVHVVTVNDYLARRDAVWMGQVYHFLGLTVACTQPYKSFLYDPSFKNEAEHDAERDETGSFKVDHDYLRPCTRKEAYAADITYGTNNEFGFDYLRDNMASSAEGLVQRELHFAVIDEVDSILIDEARTPLIISAPAEEAGEVYYRFADVVHDLIETEDYTLDEKLKTVGLNDAGVEKVQKSLGIDNLYEDGGLKTVHHVEQALKAKALFKKDRDYVIHDGEIVIVDEFTGRLMVGRRYSDGLHQAIEAKERVKIQRESVTLATVTFQNLFRLYEKLSGMTGTAETEAEEFHKIYKLEVLSIPTNKQNQRQDLVDRVYKSELGKYRAVVREIKARHETGQPVLVGTASIDKNELLSKMLEIEGVPHNVLNAKNHEKEAEFIAQAGRRGAVTVATNMAGRGVDILLGGNPADEKEAEAVKALGGLFVLGTERHESRRIDNQLRGRAGRQGDPGSTQFYLSMEDDLMRIFGSERMRKMMDTLGLSEDDAIEHKMLTKSLTAAQQKVEGHNFDLRKHVLEYDDVLNKHRTSIYRKRRDILEASMKPTVDGESPLKSIVLEAYDGEIEQIVSHHSAAEVNVDWDADEMTKAVASLLPQGMPLSEEWLKAIDALKEEGDAVLLRTKLIEAGQALVRAGYDRLAKDVNDPSMMTNIESSLLLQSIDNLWVHHLENMDYLRQGVGLQGYGQRDPLVEYKRESFRLFHEMLAAFNQRIVTNLFRVRLIRDEPKVEVPAENPRENDDIFDPSKPTTEMVDPGTLGRNDECFCGSGKKYKKCHGAS